MHGCKDGQMDRQIYTSWIRGYNRYLHMTDRQIESSGRQINTLRLKIDRYWPLKERLIDRQIDRQIQNLEYSTSLTRTRSCDLRPCLNHRETNIFVTRESGCSAIILSITDRILKLNLQFFLKFYFTCFRKINF